MGAVVGLVRAVLAAAVVGCVGRPVSAAGALPGDCDADVDAEQSREQRGGQFGSEAEQRGRASLAGREPQFAQAVREVGCAERPAGPSAGEEPLGGSLVADGGVSGAGCQELPDVSSSASRMWSTFEVRLLLTWQVFARARNFSIWVSRSAGQVNTRTGRTSVSGSCATARPAP